MESVPEMQFGVIIFSMVTAMAFSAGVLWSLHKAGAARRKKIHPPAGFMVGAVIFGFVYGINRLAFPAFPKATLLLNLSLLTGVLIFREIKKKVKRLRLREVKGPRLRVEALALERMLEIDPLNAFCYEQLTDVYEKMGRTDRALHAAREAIRLDPTVKNKLRLEDLEARQKGDRG